MDTELPRSRSSESGSARLVSRRHRLGLAVCLSSAVIIGLLTVTPSPTNAATAKTTTTKKKSATTVKKKTTTTVKKSSTTVKKSSTTVAEASETVATSTSTPTTTKPASTTLPPVGLDGRVTYFIPGLGRVLDLGAADVTKLAAGARVEIDVRGQAGLAAAGIGSVILDITTLNPTQSGRITLTPVAPDFARSVVSTSAQFVSGATTVNRVAVPVGRDAGVRVESTPGPQGLTISVVGWVVNTTAGVSEPNGTAIGPCRLVDSAKGVGLTGLVTNSRPFDLPATGVGKVPSSSSATPPAMVLMSITASGATTPTDINILPTGQQSPSLSLQASPNVSPTGVFAVPIGVDPRVAFYVPAGAANLVVDILGWIDRDGVAKSAGPCPA